MGATFVRHYNSSPLQILSSAYPDFNWQPWKFAKCPQNFWEDINNQKKFMDWASSELKIKDLSDWYAISHQVIIIRNSTNNKVFTKVGGGSLLSQYSGSLSKLLSQIYPDYNWLPWKFNKGPHNFWADIKNQRKFLEWAGKELRINDMSDWYKITNKVVKTCVFLVYFERI